MSKTFVSQLKSAFYITRKRTVQLFGISREKIRYFVLLIGVLYSFASPERFSNNPVNVHWLLFTVGTFVF